MSNEAIRKVKERLKTALEETTEGFNKTHQRPRKR